MAGPLFTIDEYVRWSDVDYAGIICYGAYVRFFEIAETELFRAAGEPYGQVFDRYDMWLPRRQLTCEFLWPARLDHRLRVAAYFKRFGNTSVTLAFDVMYAEERRLVATGEEVLVCTDRQQLRPIRFPDRLREVLAPYCFSQEEARTEMGLRQDA